MNVSVASTVGSPPVGPVITGTPGTYTLTGFGAGSYTIKPTKPGGANGSISSLDAARVAQGVSSSVPFVSLNQKFASDASGNGTVTSNDPLPCPPAGELTSRPGSAGITDQEQLSAAATSKDGLAPKAGNTGGSAETVYWQGSPEPGSAALQTPRPWVNANNVVCPALRSSVSVSVTASAKGLSSRLQVAPVSSDTNTPISVPTYSVDGFWGSATREKTGTSGRPVSPVPSMPVQVAPPSVER